MPPLPLSLFFHHVSRFSAAHAATMSRTDTFALFIRSFFAPTLFTLFTPRLLMSFFADILYATASHADAALFRQIR